MLSCLSDNGYIFFGDIFYSEFFDMEFWGCYCYVMLLVLFEDSVWQCIKIGVGFILIEILEGWLLIYYGVLVFCNGFVYSFGLVLFDIDQFWKVKFCLGFYLILFQKDYECMGDVFNVCFLCVVFYDLEIGWIVIYYGCVDIVIGFVFGYILEIIEFIKCISII